MMTNRRLSINNSLRNAASRIRKAESSTSISTRGGEVGGRASGLLVDIISTIAAVTTSVDSSSDPGRPVPSSETDRNPQFD